MDSTTAEDDIISHMQEWLARVAGFHLGGEAWEMIQNSTNIVSRLTLLKVFNEVQLKSSHLVVWRRHQMESIMENGLTSAGNANTHLERGELGNSKVERVEGEALGDEPSQLRHLETSRLSSSPTAMGQ